MEKSVNIRVEDFKREAVDLINKAGLPVSIVYMIMKELYTEVAQQYEETLQREYAEMQASMTEPAQEVIAEPAPEQ